MKKFPKKDFPSMIDGRIYPLWIYDGKVIKGKLKELAVYKLYSVEK